MAKEGAAVVPCLAPEGRARAGTPGPSGGGEASAGLAYDVDERGEVRLGRRVVQDARTQREALAQRGLGQERRARRLNFLHHALVERIERAVVPPEAARRIAEADDRQLDLGEALEIGCGVDEVGQARGERHMAGHEVADTVAPEVLER